MAVAFAEIEAARRAIGGAIVATPSVASAPLSAKFWICSSLVCRSPDPTTVTGDTCSLTVILCDCGSNRVAAASSQMEMRRNRADLGENTSGTPASPRE